ncbi:sugar ABC transporter permease [Mangrovactinospora gilvigrisea]|uniref:Sugar ABC transporter permease n=1 Tax=Mangrovactinospora gilvigrisea TaxID=1428644 RepID=A0A1J7C9T7_9ACTN|nr:sugar ABC transporter permease [Mangrovactinospora gilvigrisea]OIV36410.1 sugar ABC transporter permease [Mangrovactinospora gilvigrisea]
MSSATDGALAGAAAPATASRKRAGSTGGLQLKSGERRVGWALVAPFLVLYAVWLVGPTLYGLVMSFFNTSVARSGLNGFVGFQNYAGVLSDPEFWGTMWHSTWFTIITTIPLVILPLVFALLTNRVGRGQWIFRFAFFAPTLVPVTAVVLIFGWMYSANNGILDQALAKLGMGPGNWTVTTGMSWVSITILTVWWTIGFNYVLYLAGLQDIPTQLYEAAALDGASTFQQMRTITLPLLRRTILLVTMLQILASMKVFDQIYLLTSGGPNFSTRPVIEWIYDTGITQYRTGYAAAASIVYFVALLVVGLVWMLINRRPSEED